ELAQRLVALSADTAEAPARRAMALRLAAAARIPGVINGAFAALDEEALADDARRALEALGAVALPTLLERLTASAAPAAARAELVEVIGELVGSSEPTAEVRTALRVAAADRDRGVAAAALTALAQLGDVKDLDLAASETLSEARPVAHAAEGALATL